ncbi:MAG: AAA family ATPase [Pseudomonadota bacterium]
MNAYATSPDLDEDAAALIPPLPRVSIQAFCETPDVASSLETASVDRRMNKTHFQSHMGGIKAAIEFYDGAPTPNVIIIETQAPAHALLEDLESLAECCDAGTQVVVIGHANDIPLYRELTRRGVSEYLVAPINTIETLSALSGLFHKENAAPLGRVIAFVGAKGGVGASTIAHNCAWTISNELELDTIIVDLDLPFGTAGLDFNQDPPQGVAEAVFSPDRLDDVLLDRLLSKCSERLSLLASPATLDRPYDIDESGFEGLFDLLRATVPCIVLDVPHVWNAWTQAVLAAADEVVVVAAPDLANLRNAKNLVDVLTAGRPNDAPARLLLNGVGLAKRPEIKAADFKTAVGLEPFAVLPHDAALFGTAANNGQMIAEVQAAAPHAETFAELSRTLLGKSEAKKSRKSKSSLAPILSRLTLRKS